MMEAQLQKLSSIVSKLYGLMLDIYQQHSLLCNRTEGRIDSFSETGFSGSNLNHSYPTPHPTILSLNS